MKPFLELTHNIYNVETKKVETWTIAQMLDEINRDHSDEFRTYDQTDYINGWKEWVENSGFYKLADSFEYQYVNVEQFNEIYGFSKIKLESTDNLEIAGNKIDKFISTTNYQSGCMDDITEYLEEQEEFGFYDFSVYFIYEIGLCVAIHN